MGQTFRTGEKSPVNGDYKFVRHIDEPQISCVPTQEEMEITLERDETFPPYKSCGRGVIWELIRTRQ